MRALNRGVAALAVLASLAGTTATFSAQEIPQKPIKVEVNVTTKLIQVAVTDRKGNPILDLTPADFEVRDAGKVVKIDYLEKHNYGGPAEAVAVTAPSARPIPRKFFFVFDFAFMNPNGLKKAKTAALDFIDTALQPGDEIGLVSCSTTRALAILEYLTTDHKKVRDIVEAFGLAKLTGRAESLMDFYLIQKNIEIAEAAPRTRGEGASEDPWFQFLVKSRLSNLTLDQKSGAVGQIINFTASMRNLALTLRQIPGNKNILLFSNGVPKQLLYGRAASNIAIQETFGDADSLATYLGQNDDNLSDSAARDAYTQMLEEFEAANCPVYSFNMSQTYGEGSIALDTDSSVTMKEMSGDDSLRQFAATTGGKYYHNTMNYHEAVTDMKNLTGAYYILGYSVSPVEDGAYHKVKVKVNRKGTSVSAQPGYYNPKPFSQLSEFEKLLHLLDVTLAETPRFGTADTFALTAVPVRTDGVNLFSAYAALPAASLSDLLRKKTEAVIFLSDSKGNNVALRRFFLNDLPAGREGLLLTLSLPLKSFGSYDARLVLRNTETGRTALGSAHFEIPEVAGPWMDPLVLLEEGRNLYGFSPTPELSLGAFYNFDPLKYFPRTGAVPLGTAKILAVVRCGNLGDRADVKFSGWVQAEGSEPRKDLPVTILDQAMMGTARVAKLEIAVGDLPAGSYTLYVSAAMPGSAPSAPASATFIIK